MGHTQPSACVKTCCVMCICPLQPSSIISQYKQMTPLRSRNIPNCHSQESHHHTKVKKEIKPNSGHCSTIMTKMSFMKHSSGWVLLPLDLLFSPLFFFFFLCAQLPQALTHSCSMPGPAAERTCQQQPLQLVSQHLPEFVLHIRKPGCQNQTESKNFPSQSAWANSQGKLQQDLTS